MPSGPHDVRKYVEEHQERFLAQLAEFCAIPSVTHDRDASGRAHKFLTAYMESLGIAVESIETPGNPVVLGRTAPSAPASICYYSHFDVVPTGDGAGWDADPFSLREGEGRLFARGTADHKGWLLSRLQGVEVLRQLGVGLERNVEFLLEGDEEQGSQHLEALVRDERVSLASDVVLYSGWQRLADGTPRINGGGRGVLEAQLTLTNANRDLHGSYGPLVTHPLAYLTNLVAQLTDVNGSVSLPGFYDDARRPDERDLQALDDIPFSFAAEQERLGFTSANDVSADASKREALTQLYFTPVAYPTGYATSGAGGAIVPQAASARLRFSLVPDQDPHRLLDVLRSFLQERSALPVDVELVRAIPPARTPLDSVGFDIVRAACRRWYGDDPITVPFSSGSGPRHLFVHELGKDMIVDVGVSDVESNDHGPNESIRSDHYLDGIVHAAWTMLEVDERLG